MKKSCIALLFTGLLCLSAAVSAQECSIPVKGMDVLAIDDRPNTPKPALFPGLEEDKISLIPTAEGSSVFRTYLIRTADRLILIDTGFGKSGERKGITLDVLAKLNISPDDITDILLTHLDGDHILGLNGEGTAAYKNATVHLSEAEYEGWIVRGDARAEKSIRLARNTFKLYEGRYKTFKYGDEVLPGIIARNASGHTVGHTAFELGEDKELVIVGDLLHVEPLQLLYPAVSSIYDADKEKAAAMRELWLSRLAESGQITAGMHIRSIGKVERAEDGGYRIIPMERVLSEE